MLVTRRTCLASFGAAALLRTIGACGGGDDPVQPYSVKKVSTTEGFEHRVEFQGRHFLSVIEKQGMTIIRPHPGIDPNGWGSSLYAQPFLSNAQPAKTILLQVNGGDDGVSVGAKGYVPGAGANYGSWTTKMIFAYDLQAKKITGTGTLSIQLNGLLNAVSADLNLYRIASNYLDNVPLLSGGGTGDTGDMKQANVVGDGKAFIWVPDRDGNHYPTDEYWLLSIDVAGDYNRVDTAAQGFSAIKAAYKPGMKVVLTSLKEATMRFGASFDTGINPKYNKPRSQLFFEDNVGITAMIHRTSPYSVFEFGIFFESAALPGG